MSIWNKARTGIYPPSLHSRSRDEKSRGGTGGLSPTPEIQGSLQRETACLRANRMPRNFLENVLFTLFFLVENKVFLPPLLVASLNVGGKCAITLTLCMSFRSVCFHCIYLIANFSALLEVINCFVLKKICWIFFICSTTHIFARGIKFIWVHDWSQFLVVGISPDLSSSVSVSQEQATWG